MTEPLCLIVDDDADTCWALERVLWRHGLPSEHALDAERALALVRGRHYALALLDAKLPDMEGLELAERMEAMDPDLQVILISGYFYEDDAAIRNARGRGLIQDFIEKPFLHEELLRAVRRVLGSAGIPQSREAALWNGNRLIPLPAREVSANLQRTGGPEDRAKAPGLAGELHIRARAGRMRGPNRKGE